MCALPSSLRMRARSARSHWPCRLSNSPAQHSRAVTGQGLARLEQEAIAGLDGAPGHKAFDRSVECGATEILAGDLALQTKAKRRAGLGLEDEPALALAAWQSALAGLLIVRMDLDGKSLAGEDIFGEQR